MNKLDLGVKMVTGPRGGHYYSYQEHQNLPSVSAILGAVDDGKSFGLGNWKVRMALEKVVEMVSAESEDGTFEAWKLGAIVNKVQKVR